MRPILRTGAVLVTLLVLAWVALTVTGQLFRSEQRAAGSYGQVGRLRVATAFESVTVTGSETATTVSVARTWSWSLREPRTTTVQNGDTLALTSDCPVTPGPECRGTVTVVVPAGLTLEVSTGDGALRLDNLSGPITIDNGDGAVTAARLRSPALTAETADGAIRLAFTTPPDSVTATSGDGDIHIGLPGAGQVYRVDATTRDGTQTVTVPTDPNAERHIRADTGDGAVQITATGSLE